MSSTRSKSLDPHSQTAGLPARAPISEGAISNQASEPFSSTMSAIARAIFASRKALEQSRHFRTGSATPQTLCLERHQSGLADIMFFIRS
ncbi:MAG: hypothetical protein BWX47_01692 [candidate division Hyd24-12 bacterium ADurb.Bin004]|nr:MAG: hypothetical protein BWX47_01692 [candidate division Hyd24-12 bacterium ADurb.Bin004]